MGTRFGRKTRRKKRWTQLLRFRKRRRRLSGASNSLRGPFSKSASTTAESSLESSAITNLSSVSSETLSTQHHVCALTAKQATLRSQNKPTSESRIKTFSSRARSSETLKAKVISLSIKYSEEIKCSEGVSRQQGSKQHSHPPPFLLLHRL